MLRKIILASIAVATIALAIPTEASARYYGHRGYYGYHGYRAWGPRYYGFYPRYRRYYGYPYSYGYGYSGCWRGPYWRRIWVCG
jgi:hypothetical protein